MTYFFYLLIAMCVYMELSEKINTDNLLNKIGIACVMVGAFISVYKELHVIAQPNNLIAIGVFLHFICDINNCYKRRNRRIGDKP
jgi:hypothetical protein